MTESTRAAWALLLVHGLGQEHGARRHVVEDGGDLDLRHRSPVGAPGGDGRAVVGLADADSLRVAQIGPPTGKARRERKRGHEVQGGWLERGQSVLPRTRASGGEAVGSGMLCARARARGCTCVAKIADVSYLPMTLIFGPASAASSSSVFAKSGGRAMKCVRARTCARARARAHALVRGRGGAMTDCGRARQRRSSLAHAHGRARAYVVARKRPGAAPPARWPRSRALLGA